MNCPKSFKQYNILVLHQLRVPHGLASKAMRKRRDMQFHLNSISKHCLKHKLLSAEVRFEALKVSSLLVQYTEYN